MKQIPEITDALRQEAKKQPGGHVYCIDSAYVKDDVTGYISPNGVIGAYPVDKKGEIIPVFQANPRYTPLKP